MFIIYNFLFTEQHAVGGGRGKCLMTVLHHHLSLRCVQYLRCIQSERDQIAVKVPRWRRCGHRTHQRLIACGASNAKDQPAFHFEERLYRKYAPFLFIVSSDLVFADTPARSSPKFNDFFLFSTTRLQDQSIRSRLYLVLKQ